MEETRIGLLTESIREMVAKEREIEPIIVRCVDAMEEAIKDVVPEADTAMVAEKYKVDSILHLRLARHQGFTIKQYAKIKCF